MADKRPLPEGRWLCVDPGETTGWSIWKGKRLLGGGQTPLWSFALDLDVTVQQQAIESQDPITDDVPLGTGDQPWLHPNVDPADNTGPLGLFVVEKFVLYPWEAKNLAWDEFRTSQLIGAIHLTGLKSGIEVHKQPADVKDAARAGGAEELFVSPLHENRHQNDSIMHGWFFIRVEVLGANVPIRDKGRTIIVKHVPSA
jgi:hypothetical protein